MINECMERKYDIPELCYSEMKYALLPKQKLFIDKHVLSLIVSGVLNEKNTETPLKILQQGFKDILPIIFNHYKN